MPIFHVNSAAHTGNGEEPELFRVYFRAESADRVYSYIAAMLHRHMDSSWFGGEFLHETTSDEDRLLEYLAPWMHFYLALTELGGSFGEYMDSAIDRSDVISTCAAYDSRDPPDIDYDDITAAAVKVVIANADIDVALSSQQPLALKCFAGVRLCEFESGEIRPVCTSCALDQI